MREIILTFLISILPSLAIADIWKYQDASGASHFVNSLDRVPEQYRSSASNNLAPLSRGGSAKYEETSSPSPIGASTRNSTVEVYVTEWCKFCKALEAHLSKKNIRFKRWDIERSKEGKERYRRLGLAGVPITKIGSKILRGYDPAELDQALATN